MCHEYLKDSLKSRCNRYATHLQRTKMVSLSRSVGDLTHPIISLKWIMFDIFWKQFPNMLFNSAFLHILGCEMKTNSKATEKLWTSQHELCRTDMYHYVGLTRTIMSDWYAPLCRTDTYHYVGLTCTIMSDWHAPLCGTDMYRITIAFKFACRLTTYSHHNG